MIDRLFVVKRHFEQYIGGGPFFDMVNIRALEISIKSSTTLSMNDIYSLLYIYIYIYIKEIIKKRTKRIFHNILVLTFSLLLQIFRYNVYKCIYIYSI